MRITLAAAALFATLLPAAAQEAPPGNRALDVEAVETYLADASRTLALFNQLIVLNTADPDAANKWAGACEQMALSQALVEQHLNDLADAGKAGRLATEAANDLVAARGWWKAQTDALSGFCGSGLVAFHNDLAAATLMLQASMEFGRKASQEWLFYYRVWDDKLPTVLRLMRDADEYEPRLTDAERFRSSEFDSLIRDLGRSVSDMEALQAPLERTIRTMLYRETLWKGFADALRARDWSAIQKASSELTVGVSGMPGYWDSAAAAEEVIETQFQQFSDLFESLTDTVALMKEGLLFTGMLKNVDMTQWHGHLAQFSRELAGYRQELARLEALRAEFR